MAVDAGSIYSEVRVRLDRLTGDIKQIDTLFDQIGKGTDTTKKKTNEMSLIAVAAFAAVGLAIKKLVTSAVTAFADFEQSMANVASVAKASPEGFKLLEDAAKSAGEQTRFTASQAANALYYLASAGFDAQQSVDALNGVLELAGATQSDLAFTSEAVASAISQFSLDAADAGRVANVFTAAITNSQATMDKLATSMRYVGPVASAMGKSLEDVTGVLQILYNAGFEASQAGTALRSALSDLANVTSPAIVKLKELGVTFEEVNPETNSFADIFEVLQEKVTSAGDIMSIFGDRAGPAMIKLIQAGRGEIEKYTEAVTGTTAASVAYARQNDTLKGSIDRMKSATEAAQISFSAIFAPAIRAIVDLLTKALIAINKLPAPLKILVVGLGIGIPVVLALTVALGQLIPIIIAVGSTIATVALPIVVITAGLVALGAGIYAIKKAHDASELRIIKKDYGDFADQLGLTVEEMKNLVDAQKLLGEVNKGTLTDLNNLRISLELTTEEFKKLVKQAGRFGGVALEAFALAKVELGLTTGEARSLNAYFELYGRYTKDFNDINKQIQIMAKEFSLTVDQVIEFGLKSNDITEEYRAQLIAIKDNRTTEANYRKEQNEFLDEHKQNLKDARKSQQDIVDGVQDEIDKRERLARLNDDFNTAVAAASAKYYLKLNQLNKLKDKGFIDEQYYNTELRKEFESRINVAIEKYGNLDDVIEKGVFKQKSGLALLLIEYEQTFGEAFNLIIDVKKEEDELSKIEAGITADIIQRAKEEQTAHETALLAYAEKIKTEIEGNKKALSAADEYNKKLKELTDKNYDAIEAERGRAEASIRASGASADVIEEVIEALNEYYRLLQDKKKQDDIKKAFEDTFNLIVNIVKDAASSITALSDATADAEIANIELVRDAQLEALDAELEAAQKNYENKVALADAELQSKLDAIDAALQAALEAAGVAEETEREKLERQLQEAIDAGDAEKQAALEKAIIKYDIEADYAAQVQALKDAAELAAAASAAAEIIREDELAAAKIALEKKSAQKTALIQYDAALLSWKLQIASAAAQAAQAVLNAYTSTLAIPIVGPAAAPFAAFAAGIFAGVHVGAVIKSKPVKPTFQTGGIVIPSSGGGRDVTVAENGYPELLFNSGPSGRQFMKEFADILSAQISGKNGGTLTIIFEDAGRRIAESSARYYENNIVRLSLK